MEKEIKPSECGVTPSLFLQWRSPRFGELNPTRMDNKVWEWLIRSKKGAYQATQLLNGPSPIDAGATWCFDRFGQTSTKLPDGRLIYIAGEHEDYYDPDFNIYNDVVIINQDDSIEIYTYPEDLFPPTDFHTATLVGNTIVIIGSLGYSEKRILGETQIFLLSIDDFKLRKINSSGISPGWIHSHKAVLSIDEKSITVEKGKIDLGNDTSLIENIDDWKLDLSDWKWERLTERKWKRWDVKRCDRKNNHLWEIRQALWDQEVNWKVEHEKAMRELSKELGESPEIELVKFLYNPEIHHQKLPEKDDEYEVYRIIINDVIVRYVEEHHTIQITVEGDLSERIIEILKSDVLKKLSKLEKTECEIILI